MGWPGEDVRVVDVGTHQGERFAALGPRLREGFGVGSLARAVVAGARHAIHAGLFPDTRPGTTGWDAATMFAVPEHIPRGRTRSLSPTATF